MQKLKIVGNRVIHTLDDNGDLIEISSGEEFVPRTKKDEQRLLQLGHAEPVSQAKEGGKDDKKGKK